MLFFTDIHFHIITTAVKANDLTSIDFYASTDEADTALFGHLQSVWRSDAVFEGNKHTITELL